MPGQSKFDRARVALAPPWLRRNGLVVATSAFGIIATLAALAGSTIGAAVGVGLAILAAVLGVLDNELKHGDEVTQHARALMALCDAARQFQAHVTGTPSFGGSSVLEGGPLRVELGRLAADITAGRFNFATDGRRQYDWAALAAALREGARHFLASAGATDGLTADELIQARELTDIARGASRRALVIASAYAGFNLATPDADTKYRGADQAVDLSMLTAYRDLGGNLAELAGGLNRLVALAPVGLHV